MFVDLANDFDVIRDCNQDADKLPPGLEKIPPWSL